MPVHAPPKSRLLLLLVMVALIWRLLLQAAASRVGCWCCAGVQAWQQRTNIT
jgi:hypothetical protein